MTSTDQISSLLLRKASALVDRSASELAEINDDSFVYVNSKGHQSSKTEYIEQCTVGPLRFHRQLITELTIHEFDGFALATMILEDQFYFSGQKYNGKFRSFCAFRNVNGNWRWIGGQTSEI